jgi:hypothetical protein
MVRTIARRWYSFILMVLVATIGSTVLLPATVFGQSNVGIGTNTPNSTSILEMASTTSGLLIPRMTTTQKNAISLPATSLLVYDNTLSQFYYYSGSAWIPFLSNSSGWLLLGNGGTVASTNFLGTTDAIDLRFRTNNTERMAITSGGFIGVGTNTPGRPLEVVKDGTAGSNTPTASFRSATAGYGLMLGGIADTGTFGVIQAFGPGNVGANLVFQATLTGGFMGINTQTPGTMMDVNGDLALRDSSIALTNGAHNDVSVGGYSFIRIAGPTAAFSLTGLSGGVDGKIVILYNTTAQNMTISNDNAGSAAGNRIYTLTGAALATTGTGSITMIYSGPDSHWIVIASAL